MPSTTETLSRRGLFRAGGLALASVAAPWLPRLGTAHAAENLQVSGREELFPPSGEVNAWDGAWSLPQVSQVDTLTAGTLEDWDRRMSNLKFDGKIFVRDLRTHDQIRELIPSEFAGAFWDWKSLSDAVGLTPNRKVEDWGYFAWVHSETAVDLLPQAKDSARVLLFQATETVKGLGYEQSDPSFNSRVNSLYDSLRSQIMGMKGRDDSSILLTRNTYTGTPTAGTRFAQREQEVCSAYVPGITRGNERYGNVAGQRALLLSNEAQFVWFFALSETPLNVDDSRIARVILRSKEGKRFNMYARVFDVWSQPNHSLFGFRDVTTADPNNGPGWGSQVLPHCGIAPVQEQQQQPSGPAEQPGDGGGDGGGEEPNKTGEGETGINDPRAEGGTVGGDQSGTR